MLKGQQINSPVLTIPYPRDVRHLYLSRLIGQFIRSNYKGRVLRGRVFRRGREVPLSNFVASQEKARTHPCTPCMDRGHD